MPSAKKQRKFEEELNFWEARCQAAQERGRHLFLFFLGIPLALFTAIVALGQLNVVVSLQLQFGLYILILIANIVIFLMIRDSRKQFSSASKHVVQLYKKLYGELSETSITLEKDQYMSVRAMIYMYLLMGILVWAFTIYSMSQFRVMIENEPSPFNTMVGILCVIIQSWIGFRMFRFAYDDLTELTIGKRVTQDVGLTLIRAILLPIRVFTTLLSSRMRK